MPPAGIGGTYKKLQTPGYDEGFDELFIVKIVNNNFVVETIANEEMRATINL